MTREKLAGVLPRAALDTGAALEQIRPVCEDVRDRGAAAVREYTARFDGVDLPTSRVPAQALADALPGLAPQLRAALEEMTPRAPPVPPTPRPPAPPPPARPLLGSAGVHAAGGAQAVAMFAYGTADCAPVDVVTGPGNAYVTAAKRLLAGTVGVDAEAGPTEIAIIADHTADPRFLAADLVAQAEHGPLPACLLITTDPGLAERTEAELRPQVASARHRDTVQAALAGQSACVLVDATAAALP